MGRVPDYEIVNGHMQIKLDGFKMVMPIHIFEAGSVRGKEAIAKWRYDQLANRRVVSIGKR